MVLLHKLPDGTLYLAFTWDNTSRPQYVHVVFHNFPNQPQLMPVVRGVEIYDRFGIYNSAN